MSKIYRPLHIEVDLAALRKNAQKIKRFLGSKTKIIATVKQSAYGHGLIPVTRELSREGIDFFGVGSVEEALSLRDEAIDADILVLTAVMPEFVDCFIDHKITPTVVAMRFAKELNKQANKRNLTMPIHVKIDTGMGRLGAYYKDAYKFISEIKKLDNLLLEGLYTHFPVADSDPEFTGYQIDVFNKFIIRFKKENIRFKYHHCANSAAITNYKNSHFNMARPGLILYGVKPCRDINLNVEPVLSLKSKIVFIKRIEKGMSVSYGRTFIAKKPTRIATVSVGYADGYPWALSNNAKVIIRGKVFKLAGRVCMDHIMVDIGDREDIKAGDEVILIGKEASHKISACDLASWAKTIPYEIVSRLSLKIPRIYTSF
ncbi:MAG: alanine racemase [Candidatus Omnitrophota bacterium]|nr:MAG: alanine racemase [Candidatus Omnitrophota bacterium]